MARSRPNLPPRPGGNNNRDSTFRFGQNRNQQDSRSRFTFRAHQPFTPDSRPLLRSRRDRTPELLDGIDNGATGRKFLDLDDVSDSDEAEMDMSDEEEGPEPPKKKRVTEKEVDTAVPEKPKWSNPDPYTALPPPDETVGQTKKVDFVKLIRKAKLAATEAKAPVTNSVAANDDFISFDTPDDAKSKSLSPPPDAPTGPRHDRFDEYGQAREVDRYRDSDPALGNRKRTRDDEIKGPARVPTKVPGRMPPGMYNNDGTVIKQWMPRPSDSGTPWFDGQQQQYLTNPSSR